MVIEGTIGSPTLGYRFGPPSLRNYHLVRPIQPRERLVLDIAEYVREHEHDFAPEVLDSLTFFRSILSLNSWRARALYDIDWENVVVVPRMIISRSIIGKPIGLIKQCVGSKEEGMALTYPSIRKVLEYIEGNDDNPKASSIAAALYLAVGEESRAIAVYQRKQARHDMTSCDHYNFGTIYLLDYSSGRNSLEDNLREAKGQYGKATTDPSWKVFLYQN